MPEGTALPRPEGSTLTLPEVTVTLRDCAGATSAPLIRGPRVVSDIILTKGSTLESATDREGNIVTRLTRNSSASSLEGGYITPAGTPKFPRKARKEPMDGSGGEDPPTPGTSASSTPRTGRKRKNSPTMREDFPTTREREERVTRQRARAKSAQRSMKTPRTSDAESAGERGKPRLMIPPPQPSEPLTTGNAPEEKEMCILEPREEAMPIS